jgi:hypothetical protein
MTTGGQHDAPTGAISVGMAIFQARCAYRFVLDAEYSPGRPVTSASHLVKASACPPFEPSRAERKLSSFA